jgi:Ras-related protein Rab-1A
MRITIGYKPYSKEMKLEGVGPVMLKIWENMDEKEFRFLIPKFLRGTHGAIFCFSLTDKKTLESFDEWEYTFQKENLNIPIMLVGTKSDLIDKTSVTKEEAYEFGENHGCSAYVGVSAKENINVELAFETITKFMLG